METTSHREVDFDFCKKRPFRRPTEGTIFTEAESRSPSATLYLKPHAPENSSMRPLEVNRSRESNILVRGERSVRLGRDTPIAGSLANIVA